MMRPYDLNLMYSKVVELKEFYLFAIDFSNSFSLFREILKISNFTIGIRVHFERYITEGR